MLDQFTDFNATQFAIAICTIIVTWGLNRIGKAIDMKATAQTTSANAVSAKTALETLSILVGDTVKYLNATLVDDLKNAAADGKLTEAESKEIFEKAFTTISESMSDDMKNLLTTYYGDLEKLITRKIEVYVKENKTTYLAPFADAFLSSCDDIINGEDTPATPATDAAADTTTPTAEPAKVDTKTVT